MLIPILLAVTVSFQTDVVRDGVDLARGQAQLVGYRRGAGGADGLVTALFQSSSIDPLLESVRYVHQSLERHHAIA
jgi:hypothetical protein